MMDHSGPLEAPPPYTENRNEQLETPSPSLAARSPRESLSPEPEFLPDRKLPLPRAQANQGPSRPVAVEVEHDDKHDQDDPPQNAQRARAPLLVAKTNSSIKGDWLLFTEQHGDTKDTADAMFQTTNSSITAALWISDSKWKSPVKVEFKTTNSSIGVAVHTKIKGQAVNISSITSNSRNEVLLPTDFHGIVKMSTSNNRCNLSDSLRRRSVRVPNGPDERKEHAEWYEIGPPGGKSVAEVRTSNSRVTVGLVGDQAAAAFVGSSTGKGSCVVS